MKTVQSIGRYRIDGLIGIGAMGEVYRAYDPVIDRPVAIKIVRTELAAGSGPFGGCRFPPGGCTATSIIANPAGTAAGSLDRPELLGMSGGRGGVVPGF